jgi:hypothetical protein
MTLRQLAEAILKLPAEQQSQPALFMEPYDDATAHEVTLVAACEEIVTETRVICLGQTLLV